MAMIHGLSHFYAEDPEKGAALRDTMRASVDEVGRVCKTEGIEADFYKGGGINLATNALQAERLREDFESDRAMGWTEDDIQWLDPDELTARIRIASSYGGTFNFNTAAVNPAKLARGVADAAERRGAAIYEQTTVNRVEAGRVHTSRGTVRADRIVMALDGFVTQMPGCRRNVIPTYEHMIATEPLSDRTWEEIGLSERGLFGDASRLFMYAQRTADNRIAIGGRAVGYHFGSKIDSRYERSRAVEKMLVDSLHEMLPQIGKFAVTHRWGGVLGLPRDLMSSLHLDEKTGIAGAGSYSGEGVCPSNLAGRTLCDLTLGRDTPLTELPWVGHQSPRWEPEPLRWLGVRTGMALSASTDRADTQGRHSPIRERLLSVIGADG
jgi:glycine/D-amino acid oxidase-like deaminating enzyme